MATYKHLRSSTANKRPTTSIADGQLAINTNTASPGLFFKDSAGTGIVKVGPVHVGTTAPNSVPASGGSTGNYLGEQWLDTSVSPAQMKVWNGSTWVGVVADELPVSKLQDGAAGQIVQTDSAGTGVEWSSTANLPVGSASVPAYRFQGDANTGLYSPGADQVAISTGGTGRLFVDSSGRVGLGTSSPSSLLDLSSASPKITLTSTSTGADSILDATSAFGSIWIGADENNEVGPSQIVLAVDGSPKVNIKDTGNVGIGTTSPSRGPLHLHQAGATNTYLKLTNGTTGETAGDGTEIIVNTSGGLLINNTESTEIAFATAATERLRIDSSGRLLVGTSSDSGGALLQVNGDRVRIATAKTPASASDTGTTGEICWDANYIYVCTATNTWKRSAISTW